MINGSMEPADGFHVLRKIGHFIHGAQEKRRIDFQFCCGLTCSMVLAFRITQIATFLVC